MNQRVLSSIILGAILGVVCIVGASIRFKGDLAFYFLFAFWLNRVFMGGVIGLLPEHSNLKFVLVRGAIIGLLVSFTFYAATDFFDTTGFLVGAVYGVILEYSAFRLQQKKS